MHVRLKSDDVIYMYVYIYYIYMYVYTSIFLMCMFLYTIKIWWCYSYGVATISRLLKITGSFLQKSPLKQMDICKRDLSF